MDKIKTARQTAAELLIKTEKNGAYSNLALDAALSSSQLSARDKSLITVLYYGVLERKITLDYLICHYTKIPFQKISSEILSILRLGFYQLLYLDSVPDAVAVNESVLLAEYFRKKSAKGFINAILRSFLRNEKKIELPDLQKDPVRFFSIFYSCPEWLVKKWFEDYGLEQTEQILKQSLGCPPITLKVNTLHISAKKLMESLAEEGVSTCLHPTIPDCLILKKSSGIEQMKAYRQGFFHIQDIASQICCMALDPQPGEHVLDVCAAPGGKAFTSAILMQNNGLIQAFDLYPKRTKLIENGASRLGISIIKPDVADAKQYHPELCGADRVLCDVPCSGTGVIRRKPEIKYKNYQELDRLPDIQYQILENAARYVKSGGTLLYSTCALNKQENDEIAKRFLLEHKEFQPKLFPNKLNSFMQLKSNTITLFPDKNGSDGFFIALFERR